jgi:hypothetical protein
MCDAIPSATVNHGTLRSGMVWFTMLTPDLLWVFVWFVSIYVARKYGQYEVDRRLPEHFRNIRAILRHDPERCAQ